MSFGLNAWANRVFPVSTASPESSPPHLSENVLIFGDNFPFPGKYFSIFRPEMIFRCISFFLSTSSVFWEVCRKTFMGAIAMSSCTVSLPCCLPMSCVHAWLCHPTANPLSLHPQVQCLAEKVLLFQLLTGTALTVTSVSYTMGENMDSWEWKDFWLLIEYLESTWISLRSEIGKVNFLLISFCAWLGINEENHKFQKILRLDFRLSTWSPDRKRSPTKLLR